MQRICIMSDEQNWKLSGNFQKSDHPFNKGYYPIMIKSTGAAIISKLKLSHPNNSKSQLVLPLYCTYGLILIEGYNP